MIVSSTLTEYSLTKVEFDQKSAPSFVFCTRNPVDLDFSLRVNNDGKYDLTEKFDYNTEDSYATMGNDRSFVMDDRDIEHFPHNMVESYFCQILSHDKKIGQVLDPSGDPDFDNPSPDLIVHDVTTCFMEFTTRIDPGSCTVAYSRKESTYSDVADYWKANLLILVVSTDRIYCNFDISQDSCNILVSRFNYGKKVQNEAKRLGWTRKEDDERKDKKAKIEEAMNRMDWISIDDPLNVNKEDVRELLSSEPDTDYILKLLEESRLNHDSKVRDDDMKLASERIKSFKSEIRKNRGRSDNKAVVQFCGFTLRDKDKSETKFKSYDLMSNESTEEGTLARFWKTALLKEKDPEYIKYEESKDLVEELPDEKVIRKSKERHEIKSERCKVDVRLSSTDRVNMSNFGVGAKKYKNTAEKIMSDEKNKGCFSWNTDLSDIDKFINGYEESMEELETTNIIERILPFLEYSNEMDYEINEPVMRILKSKIGQTCLTASAIFSEINLNARKSLVDDEWIVITSCVLPCKIAIKNTKTDKHIFYTVLFHEDDLVHDYGRPFRNLRKLPGGYYSTPVCSLNTHDLSMWLSLPSHILATDSVWRDIMEDDLIGDTSAGCEIMTSVLLMLEHKESTATPTFNTRYMYMEMIKPEEWKCDPFKVLTKFPKLIRSRFLLWLTKKVMENFAIMLSEREPIQFEVSIGEDDVQKEIGNIPFLRSYVSGEKIRNISVALNLSYIGVFHNIDKGEKLHGFLKIFSKVISEELKMREADMDKMKNFKYNYKGLPSELKSHEFSVDHVRLLARTLKRHWRRKGFDSNDLKETVLNSLSDVSFEDLATMKASANSENFRGSSNPSWKDYDQKKRNKALDEVIELIGELKDPDVCVFANLDSLFLILNRKGGIIANLFKKNQPTGVREIFVLTMISRVVVKFMETVSRSLCNITDNEYLTKGKDKVSSTPEHYKKVRREKGGEDITMSVSDSSDATTWCQRFIMPVFQVLFAELFDFWPDMSKTLCSILNLMTAKRLELPKELLDLFKDNPNISSYDENMSELKDQFLGMTDENDIIIADKILMTNRSNFMQGIMHFTSSLIHAAHMIWVTNIIKSVFDVKVIGVHKIKARIISTTKVSSDDSSRITTIISDDTREKSMKYFRGFLLWSSCFSESSYPLFCAKQSQEKSSIGIMCMIEEFNSMWTIANTVVTPKIKWAYSSQILKVTSSVTERQNSDHGVLNDLVENGARRTTVQMAEFGCLLNHYSTIGYLTLEDDFYYSLINDIFDVRSNVGWFYNLSHSKIGTALGYQFTKWVNLSRNKKARQTEEVARMKMLGEPGESGTFDLHTTLPVGFAKNYYEFLEKLNIPTREEIDDMITDSEHILFSKPTNISETLAVIRLKTLSSSLIKSFSFASSSKQHSVSAYICTRPCITVRSLDQAFKASLPCVLNEIIQQRDKEVLMDELLFPQIDLYETIASKVKTLVVINSGPQNNRKFYHKMRVPNLSRLSRVPLIDVINKIWFKKNVRFPKFSVNLAFLKYESRLPWMKRSFDESFVEFNRIVTKTDKLAFSEYIKNFDSEPKTVVFQNSGNPKIGFEENFLECVKNNYKPNSTGVYITNKDESMRLMTSVRVASDIESNLLKVLTGPPGEKLTKVKQIIKVDQFGLNIKPVEVIGLTNRQLSLSLISCLSSVLNREDLTEDEMHSSFEVYKTLREGLIAIFVQPQVKKEGKYQGIGKIRVDIGDIKCMITIDDNNVTMLETNNILKLRKEIGHLSRFLISQNLTLTPSRRILENALTLRGRHFDLGTNSRGVIVVRSDLEEMSPKSVKFSLGINKAMGLSLRFDADGLQGETVSFYPRFVNRMVDVNIGSNTQKSWYNHTTLTLDKAKTLIRKTTNSSELRKWVVNSLNARFIENNVIKQTFPNIEIDADSPLSVAETLPFDDDFEDPVTGNFASRYDIDFPSLDDNERVVAQIPTDLPDVYVEDIDAMLEDPKSYTASRILFLRKHPFWDNYVILVANQIKANRSSDFGLITRSILSDAGVNVVTVQAKVSDFLSI